MDGILPAAGQSSRMRGLPKFLLPCDDNYVTLLEYHIGMMYESCDVIWIPTRSEFVQLIESLNFPRDKVVILPLTTRSMTETVMNVLKISGSMSFLLEMPDTFYKGVKPVEILNHSPVIADLGLFPIRDEQRGKLGQCQIDENQRVVKIIDKDSNCDLPLAWGALTFARELISFMDIKQPHIGYSVAEAIRSGQIVTSTLCNSLYFDCGTPSEYLAMLREVF
jgi:hypothetical protein